MIPIMTRELFLAEIERECSIAIHLFEKIPAGGAEYRPTPGQRSTLELLRYLSVCGIASAQGAVDGDITGAKELWRRSADMAFEEFPAAMERQRDDLLTLVRSIPDENFATHTAKYPTGEMLPLAEALLRSTYKWLVGYRMQLFLYAKAAGAAEIGTLNNWIGMDMPAAQPA